MKKFYYNTKEEAVKHAESWLTKGDWLEEDIAQCACGCSPAIKLRDAHIGKVRATFIICEACSKDQPFIQPNKEERAVI